MTVPGPSVGGIVIAPPGRLALDLADLWHFRELLYFLVWREIRVRYKQTVLGAAWAILQPLATTLVFTAVFSVFAKIPSDGYPYPVFAYAALLPWTYFAQALTRSTASLVGDANLIRKVYFPRLVIPLSAVISAALDFAVSFGVFLGLMTYFGVHPTWRLLTLFAMLPFVALTALAVGLWLSVLNVRYRDIGHTIPFIVQLWMYASPIAYPLSLVPAGWRLLYSINPIVGVSEAFRWALLGQSELDVTPILLALAVVAVLLAGGLAFFKRWEPLFADVI